MSQETADLTYVVPSAPPRYQAEPLCSVAQVRDQAGPSVTQVRDRAGPSVSSLLLYFFLVIRKGFTTSNESINGCSLFL